MIYGNALSGDSFSGIDPQTQANLALWASVFKLGLQDAAYGYKRYMYLSSKYDKITYHDVPNEDQRQALLWLHSDDHHVGSFEWLCELFDINPHQARSMWRSKVRSLATAPEPKEEVAI